MDYQLYIRPLADLSKGEALKQFDDAYGLCAFSEAKTKALLSNPFVGRELDYPVQFLGIVGTKIVGQVTVFPTCFCANGVSYIARAGSGLYVHENYRKSMLGADLILHDSYIDADTIEIGCGLSKLALPLHQLLDFVCFTMPRLVWAFKSRAVVEKKLGETRAARLAALCIDGVLGAHAALLRAYLLIKTRRYTVRQVSSADGEVENVARSQATPFYCLHSAAWFNWQLNASFSGDPRSRQKLFTVKNGAGETVGFFLYKIRFHEKASQQGYTNILLGSLMEWQSADPARLSHATLALMAMLEMRKDGADVVEVCTDDHVMLRQLRRFGLRPVGELNFVFWVAEACSFRRQAGWDRQENWRLRPCEGDNGLS